MPLAERVSDLAAAVRDKINLMVPRILPSGGAAGEFLVKASASDYAAAWGAAPLGVHCPIKPPAGAYISPLLVANSLTTIAGAALRCDFIPFISMRSVSVDRIGVEVTTLLASSTALVGIYADTGSGAPGARLVGGGTSLGCSTVGLKEETISITLQAGVVYWLAIATSSTQTLRASAVGNMLPLAVNSANGSPFNLRRATLASMALPSNAPATTLTGAAAPLHRLRLAA